MTKVKLTGHGAICNANGGGCSKGLQQRKVQHEQQGKQEEIMHSGYWRLKGGNLGEFSKLST